MLRRPALALAALLLSTLVAGCGSGSEDPKAPVDAQSVDRFASAALYAPPDARLVAAAKQATADGRSDDARILDRMAAVPTGVWLTPEEYPTESVAAEVTSVLEDAGAQIPVLVVYGIPDRDCTGGFSSGGLTDQTYLPWVTAIAEAADHSHAVVVLEPDAVAASTTCDHPTQRLALLGGAVDELVDHAVTTYVDAGHSGWVDPQQMADLLTGIGIDRVRGFATNVANYQPQAAEVAYATELARDLGGSPHFVIDTGRNGDPQGGGQPVTDWCNPDGRALGTEPGYVDDGTPLDAVLWIKPPDESDGTCHGGPSAGEPWIERAVELGRAAQW